MPGKDILISIAKIQLTTTTVVHIKQLMNINAIKKVFVISELISVTHA